MRYRDVLPHPLRKLLTPIASVIHSTSKPTWAAYDRGIETNAIEKDMTIKAVKFSLTAVLVAFSLLAFTTIVFG